jgi:hypothetical protein
MGYRDFNDGDSFDGRGDEIIDPDVERGYYRFDLQRYRAAYGGAQVDYNVVFQGGRDLAYWVNGLVLAQVLDGVTITASTGGLQLDLIAGITPTRTVDIDSFRPNFDHNTRRGFFGGMLSARMGAHRPFAYFLVQRDYNDDNFATFGGNTPTRFRYNSTYLGFGSTGNLGDRLRYGVEVALEGGRELSSSYEVFPTSVPLAGGGFTTVNEPQAVGQRNELIQAFAADVRLDYVVSDPRRTRLSAEFVLASGDTDRRNTTSMLGGNRRGSDDHAFNGFGLINTGLAFAPAVSNLLAVRVGASSFRSCNGACGGGFRSASTSSPSPSTARMRRSTSRRSPATTAGSALSRTCSSTGGSPAT